MQEACGASPVQDGLQCYVPSLHQCFCAVQAASGDMCALDAVKLELALYPMPLTVNIFSCLQPLDLLHLSRACKIFRSFFLDKKRQIRWDSALKNAPELPPRSSSISAPAFVHLLFSPYCHSCGVASVRETLPGSLTRCCPKCLPQWTIWYKDAIPKAGDASRFVREVLSHDEIPHFFAIQDRSDSLLLDPGFNRLLKYEFEHITRIFEGLPRPLTDEAFEAFKQALREEREERLQCSVDVETYLTAVEMAREAELEAARKKQLDQILERLKYAGWDKELAHMGSRGIATISAIPIVRQTSKLTEGAWWKILTALNDFLKQTQKERLDKEIRDALRTRFEALENILVAHYVTLPRTADMDCRPWYIDIALLPPCRALLDKPSTTPVPTAKLETLIPTLADEWYNSTKTALAEYICPHLGEIAAGVAPLTLAIAVFPRSEVCQGTARSLRFPALLAHNCACRMRTQRHESEWLTQKDEYTRIAMTLGWTETESVHYEYDDSCTVRVPFNAGALPPPETAAEGIARMRRIVSALGLDPARATPDDLDRCDLWLRCTTCETARPNDDIFMWTWSGAFEHERMVHKDNVSPTWRQVDSDSMANVHVLKAMRSFTFPDSGRWSCSLCSSYTSETAKTKIHLADVHGNTDAAKAMRDGLVYLHPSIERSTIFPDHILFREGVKTKAAWPSNVSFASGTAIIRPDIILAQALLRF
ncbi:hypothetical protein C8Q79DRAFT_1078974 [Trametes meyenii]|nr:hypothetical protein C8Q79DRAFT_1078974 [Trametes meyenii]